MTLFAPTSRMYDSICTVSACIRLVLPHLHLRAIWRRYQTLTLERSSEKGVEY